MLVALPLPPNHRVGLDEHQSLTPFFQHPHDGEPEDAVTVLDDGRLTLRLWSVSWLRRAMFSSASWVRSLTRSWSRFTSRERFGMRGSSSLWRTRKPLHAAVLEGLSIRALEATDRVLASHRSRADPEVE